MPTPDFVLDPRAKSGHGLLWLSGVKAVILRAASAGIGARGGGPVAALGNWNLVVWAVQ